MKLTGVSGGTCLDSWSDLIDTGLGGLTEHRCHLLSHRGQSVWWQPGRYIYIGPFACLGTQERTATMIMMSVTINKTLRYSDQTRPL